MWFDFDDEYTWTRWAERDGYVPFEQGPWVGDDDMLADHPWARRFETAKRLLWNEYGDEVLRPLWQHSRVEGDVIALLGEPMNISVWVSFREREEGHLYKNQLPDGCSQALTSWIGCALPDDPIFQEGWVFSGVRRGRPSQEGDET